MSELATNTFVLLNSIKFMAGYGFSCLALGIMIGILINKKGWF